MKYYPFKYLLSLLVLVVSMVLMPATNAEILAPGDVAPSFSLQATNNQYVALKDYSFKYLIVVFYPKDNTPGCTVQLCSLRDTFAQLQKQNIQVVAINPDSLKSHQKFSDDKHYPFPLATDPNNTIAKEFGVKSMFGWVNKRTVFIISPSGNIIFSEEGMPTPEELMAAVKRHQAGH